MIGLSNTRVEHKNCFFWLEDRQKLRYIYLRSPVTLRIRLYILIYRGDRHRMPSVLYYVVAKYAPLFWLLLQHASYWYFLLSFSIFISIYQLDKMIKMHLMMSYHPIFQEWRRYQSGICNMKKLHSSSHKAREEYYKAKDKAKTKRKSTTFNTTNNR